MAWQGKTRGSLLGYKIFFFLIQYGGLIPAYVLLRFVSLYFFLFVPKAAKAIYFYFHQVLGHGKLKALWMTRLNFYVFGQTLVDKFAILSGLRNKYTYHFDGEENLIEMANTTGGILIGAHLGNWDVAGNFLNRVHKTFNIVMFEGEHEQIKQFENDTLKDKRVNIIPIKDDLSHIFQISNAIARKELVCFHGDRFTPGAKTVEMDFFGKAALFPHGPFYIATKFKVPYSFKN